MNAWDPIGYQVVLRSLDEEQQKKILEALSNVTGYKLGQDEEGNYLGLYLDEDGKLTIAEGAIRDGGSNTAADALTGFIDDSFNVDIISVPKGADRYYAFAAASKKDGSKSVLGEKMSVLYVDFKDWNDSSLIQSNDVPIEANGLGVTLFHELKHNFTGLKDPRTKKMVDHIGLQGPVVQFTNKIRSELGLPQRDKYILPMNSKTGIARMDFSVSSTTRGGKIRMKKVGCLKINYKTHFSHLN